MEAALVERILQLEGETEVPMCETVCIAIILGLPLCFIYLFGWQLHRGWKSRPASLSTSPALGGDGNQARGVFGRMRTPCWEVKCCPAELRRGCAAGQNTDLPCWQAVKAQLRGRVKDECPGCPLFLVTKPGRM